MRNLSLGLMAFFSLGVAAYAFGVYGFMPLGAVVDPDMRANFQAHPVGIYTHVFASAVALALGSFQFVRRLRLRWPAWHRWAGRVYLGLGVLPGGLAGLWMAFFASGGAVGRMGFAALALAWLYTGTRAYLSIRAGDVVAHRRWMVRNFALTLAAVTLRLWLPAALSGARLPYEVAYPVIAWLCWVPNLMVAEVVLNRTAPLPAPPRTAQP